MNFTGLLNAAIVALVMAEAVWHSDGKVGLRQLSFAACKRTLSYAFGRALEGNWAAMVLRDCPRAGWKFIRSLIPMCRRLNCGTPCQH